LETKTIIKDDHSNPRPNVFREQMSPLAQPLNSLIEKTPDDHTPSPSLQIITHIQTNSATSAALL